MKGGFLRKARPGDPEEVVGPGKKTWPEAEVDLMAKVFAEVLDDNSGLARKDLERRVRTGTGVREFRGNCGPQAVVAEADRDVAYRLITEHCKHASLMDMVPVIMEQVADIYKRVEDKGKKEGMSMDSESETKVLRDIVKESLIRHVLKLINNENSGNYASGSHDAGLLATPQGYYAGDLESLSGDILHSLMHKGIGYQDDFMDSETVKEIYNEMELMDFDGKFVDVQQQKMIGIRKDRIGWLTLEQLDREKQPGLCALFKKIISVPFELNKKCSLYLQAGGNFQLACYAKDTFYKRHVDGGYEELNNGRKVTAIFYPNINYDDDHGGSLKVYKRRLNPFQTAKMKKEREEAGLPPPEAAELEPAWTEANEVELDIQPRGGRLVLMRARDMPHEVCMANKKRYAISLFLTGPPGPGDMPDSPYTPT